MKDTFKCDENTFLMSLEDNTESLLEFIIRFCDFFKLSREEKKFSIAKKRKIKFQSMQSKI
jgi:hypothetical protein